MMWIQLIFGGFHPLGVFGAGQELRFGAAVDDPVADLRQALRVGYPVDQRFSRGEGILPSISAAGSAFGAALPLQLTNAGFGGL